jgi:CheY-like chemotaxis protein
LKTRPVRASSRSAERDPAPGHRYSVNLVSDDLSLRERLLQAGRRSPALALHFCAAAPADGASFAAQLVPASAFLATPELKSLRARAEAILAYGPAQLLPGCFLAGCDDYLKEPWTLEELEWRLRRLLPEERRRYLFGWGSFTLEGLTLASAESDCPLSWPELRILRLLADHPAQVVPREALYYAIWGRGGARGSRVADVHVSRLRRKLLALFPESAGALRTVRGQGYLLE